MKDDRLPPHSIEAEMCTIASLILCQDDESTFGEIVGLVDERSFFQPDHRVYFKIITHMRREGRKVDAVSIKDELKRIGVLEEVGDTAYLGKMLYSVPSYTHGPEYAKRVKEYASKREIIETCTKAIEASHGPSEASAISSSLGSAAADIAVRGAVSSIRHIADDLKVFVNPSEAPRLLPTGLREFDDIAGGLPFGQFCIVGGRPGMGKSMLVKQFMLNIAKTGVPCGLVTIEESGSKVAQNLLANITNVENNRIAFGRATSTYERGAIEDGVAIGSKLPIFMDEASIRLGDIESTITRMALKHGCRFIAVDYLQLVDPGMAETENREITQVCRSLKWIFKKLNLANAVACQLNRGGDNKEVRRPVLKDLRGSGSIEQDSDLIVLLHREDYYRQHDEGYNPDSQVQLIIAKNKNAGQGIIPAHFNGRYQRISDWNNGKGVDPNAPPPKEKSFKRGFDPFADEAA